MRVQFGRPIGQFQAVKHALADMLVAVEQCAAVAWDAAAAWSEAPTSDADTDAAASRHLSARIAGAVALPGAAHCAKQCIQTLGGIGFTWEHDAHLYLKRAMANLQLVSGGDVGAIELDVAGAGGRRRPAQPGRRPARRGGVAAVDGPQGGRGVAAAGADDPSGLTQRAASPRRA